MKVLIYFQDQDTIKKSGIGRAQRHQLLACSLAGVETTTDPKDTYDIAHINTYLPKSRHVLNKCKKKGIPVIVHGHSTHEDFRDSFACWRLMAPFYDGFMDAMYKRADLIIAPTPYAKGLIDSYGFGVESVSVSNGIDLKEYAPDPEAQRRFREKLGVKEGEKFVMGVGFPFERKGLIDFIEVARAFPDVKFIWFGHLQRILTSHKIKKAVRHRPGNVIMAGYQSGDIIHGAYQTASVMFFPSHEETEGIVVLEALASKTPLLIRDIGVYADWLHDGADCHKGKTNEDFIKVIRSLLDDGEKPEVLEAGYKLAEERAIAKVGEELKANYEALLKKKKGQ
jgi:1,2-diacylglycerol-3-alpha-glucose alpha-1,2-glucosyltransferase